VTTASVVTLWRFVTGQWSVICAVSCPLLSTHTERGPSFLKHLHNVQHQRKPGSV